MHQGPVFVGSTIKRALTRADVCATSVKFLLWPVQCPPGPPRVSHEKCKCCEIALTQKMATGTKQRCSGPRPFRRAHGSRATRSRAPSGHCRIRRRIERNHSASTTLKNFRVCGRTLSRTRADSTQFGTERPPRVQLGCPHLGVPGLLHTLSVLCSARTRRSPLHFDGYDNAATCT